MNNKGFMMAEVVVVSSIILVFLTGLYMSYNKLFAVYKERSTYYDVNTLYRLASIVDDRNAANGGNLYNMTDSSFPIVSTSNEETYIIKTEDIDALILNVENQTFKDYLNFISEGVKFESEVIAVYERCDSTNIDKCTYAYLDIFSS